MLTGFKEVAIDLTEVKVQLARTIPPVLRLIRERGQDFRMSGQALAKMVGAPNTSEIRAMIGWLRAKRTAGLSRIGIDSKGYFWCNTLEEAQDTLAHLEQRACRILTVRSGLEQSFE